MSWAADEFENMTGFIAEKCVSLKKLNLRGRIPHKLLDFVYGSWFSLTGEKQGV